MSDPSQTPGEWKEVDPRDLKPNDCIRMTLEGVVVRPGGGEIGPDIALKGSGVTTRFTTLELNAGKLERQERPLAVGDRVRSYAGDATVLAVDGTHAWVKRPDGTRATYGINDLERV